MLIDPRFPAGAGVVTTFGECQYDAAHGHDLAARRRGGERLIGAGDELTLASRPRLRDPPLAIMRWRLAASRLQVRWLQPGAPGRVCQMRSHMIDGPPLSTGGYIRASKVANYRWRLFGVVRIPQTARGRGPRGWCGAAASRDRTRSPRSRRARNNGRREPQRIRRADNCCPIPSWMSCSMRSRSASAAATRRRAIRRRVAHENRLTKRTLVSTGGPPSGPPAPFVAGAPLAARPSRKPSSSALTFACSERPLDRTDLTLSTRIASRRSTLTSSEPWPEPLTESLNHSRWSELYPHVHRREPRGGRPMTPRRITDRFGQIEQRRGAPEPGFFRSRGSAGGWWGARGLAGRVGGRGGHAASARARAGRSGAIRARGGCR